MRATFNLYNNKLIRLAQHAHTKPIIKAFNQPVLRRLILKKDPGNNHSKKFLQAILL